MHEQHRRIVAQLETLFPMSTDSITKALADPIDEPEEVIAIAQAA